MSNRSAKLLLEVSKHLSAHVPAHHKMAGCLSLPVPIGLAEEVTRWAKGYEDWLSKAYDRKIAEEQKRAAERILALKESMTDEDLAAADKIAEQLGFSEPRTADYSAVGERFAELADKTFGRPSEGHRSGTDTQKAAEGETKCTARERGYARFPELGGPDWKRMFDESEAYVRNASDEIRILRQRISNLETENLWQWIKRKWGKV